MEDFFEGSLQQHKAAISHVEGQFQNIIKFASSIRDAWGDGGKLIVMGNGGSAADAQHLASECMGRFQKERRALPAIALTTDSSILTSISNDYSFEVVFSRQIEGLATHKDIILGISTSGNSKNIILGIQAAKALGAQTLGLTGNPGKLADLVDRNVTIPDLPTARVQEAHIYVIHLLCELLDYDLSPTISTTLKIAQDDQLVESI
ncbi:MAG: SIS domain-containing protein [Gammaproteobacteria bacterium]|nr:SIS domain-containing protein [Gammaproteobacteria bacterium]